MSEAMVGWFIGVMITVILAEIGGLIYFLKRAKTEYKAIKDAIKNKIP